MSKFDSHFCIAYIQGKAEISKISYPMNQKINLLLEPKNFVSFITMYLCCRWALSRRGWPSFRAQCLVWWISTTAQWYYYDNNSDNDNARYDSLLKLEELHLRNLGMGSVLILLPFCPNVRKLTLKYSLRSEEGAPNITDSLFQRIFTKNKFSALERVEIWCKSLSIRTAEWLVRNCHQLQVLRSLSAWSV